MTPGMTGSHGQQLYSDCCLLDWARPGLCADRHCLQCACKAEVCSRASALRVPSVHWPLHSGAVRKQRRAPPCASSGAQQWLAQRGGRLGVGSGCRASTLVGAAPRAGRAGHRARMRRCAAGHARHGGHGGPAALRRARLAPRAPAGAAPALLCPAAAPTHHCPAAPWACPRGPTSARRRGASSLLRLGRPGHRLGELTRQGFSSILPCSASALPG